ncbi:MAG: hypothetical protein WCF65_06750 [Parachlamydiaceae bacterium]
MSTDSNTPTGMDHSSGTVQIKDNDDSDLASLLGKHSLASNTCGALVTVEKNDLHNLPMENIAHQVFDRPTVSEKYLESRTFRHIDADPLFSVVHVSTPSFASQSHLPIRDVASQTYSTCMDFASQERLSGRQRAFSDCCSANALSTYNPTPIYIFHQTFKQPEQDIPQKPAEEEIVVSEARVLDINRNGGREEDYEWAEKAILKMRRMGGLEPLKAKERVDIPAARNWLCTLYGLDSQKYKIFALKSLLEILQADRGEAETGDRLVDLAIKLIAKMDKNEIQKATMDVQIVLAKVYSILIDTIRIHYEKKHIGAITGDLKLLLGRTAVSFGLLNRHEDSALKFYIRSSIEGSTLLADDAEQLFELAKRLYLFTSAVAAIHEGDFLSGYPRLEESFSDLDKYRMKSDWYTATLSLKSMVQQAKSDSRQLLSSLFLIERKRHELNWKFSYAAVLVLADLCIHGETEEIRRFAFHGMSINIPGKVSIKLPGLKTFLDSKDLATRRTWGPVVHLKPTKKVDYNPRIQVVCEECFRQLLVSCPDEWIRKEIREALARK